MTVATQASTRSVADVLGTARFATYLHHAGNDHDALQLYRWNLEMSGALHEALCIAEVALRNVLDRELRTWNAMQPPRRGATYGDNWIENPAGPLWAILHPGGGRGGPRRSVHREANERALKDQRDRRPGHRRHGMPVDHDDLVAHLTFGTWKKMLARKDAHHPSGIGPVAQRTLWNEALHRSFPNKPSPTVIHYWVDRLHTLRNRVAHHEPLCDTDPTSYHRTVARLLRAMDPALAEWFAGVSRIPEVDRRRP